MYQLLKNGDIMAEGYGRMLISIDGAFPYVVQRHVRKMIYIYVCANPVV